MRPLTGQQLFQHFEFPLGQFMDGSLHGGRMAVEIQDKVLVTDCFMLILPDPAAAAQDGGDFAD